MLTLFIASTLLMPFMTALLWDKKHIISIYVGSFIVTFLVINVLNSWVINIWAIRTFFILGYIVIYSLFTLFGIKNKKFNWKNLLNTSKWILPLYLSMGLMFFVRLWFTRMNTDALWYANISNYIQDNKMITTEVEYQLPSFYSFAAIFPRPINVFSVGGDVIVISILATALFKIIDDARDKRDWFTWFIMIFASLSAALCLPFVTSSVNWVIVSLVIIVMLALKDDVKLLLLTPIAFTIFSFSSMLLMPIGLVYVVLAKRFTLKELIDFIVIFMMSNVIFIIVLMRLTNKLMLIPLLFSLLLFLPYTNIVKEVEIDGLYLQIKKRVIKDENKVNIEWTKKRKIISLVVISIIGLITIILFINAFDRRKYLGEMIIRVMTNQYIWSVPCIILIILNSLWNKKMTSWMKFSLGFIITTIVYCLTIKISSRVPSYILYRTTEPIIAMIIPVFLIFIYENYSWKEFDWKYYVALTLAILLPIGTVVETSKTKYFYSNPSTNIAENYKWIKDKEWDTIEKFTTDHPHQKVYSDLPIFIMETKGRKKNTVMTASGQRELFHGDLFVSMLGRKKYVEEHRKSIDKNIDKDGIFKWTIKYAEYYGDWSKIDQSNVFIFRHKEYALKIMAHYRKANLEMINGLYVITRK